MMEQNLKKVLIRRAEKVVSALEANNMKGYITDTPESAMILIEELVKNDKLITSGGSITLDQTGIRNNLTEKYPGIYLDRSSAKSPEEAEEIMRKAFVSDTFITSTNAITEEGELYNVDGNGNRIAAMIYGPKQVIVVCGLNKIVTDLATANDRIETITAPANAVRLNRLTPCTKEGRCAHCSSPDRICCDYLILAQQRIKNRIKVIFIADEYGY